MYFKDLGTRILEAVCSISDFYFIILYYSVVGKCDLMSDRRQRASSWTHMVTGRRVTQTSLDIVPHRLSIIFSPSRIRRRRGGGGGFAEGLHQHQYQTIRRDI